MNEINRRQLTTGLLASLGAPAMSSARAKAQSNKIRIGLITQMSGFAQAFGYADRSGAEIAIDRINAQGGVNGQQLELTVRDDRGTTDGAIAAYRELADDGIKFFVGGPISGPIVAVGPMVANTDHLFIAAGGGSLAFTHENYNPNVFRVMFTVVPFYSSLAYVVAKANPTARKWAAIGSDQQVGVESIKVFNQSVKKFYADMYKVDIEITEPLLTKAGSGDFRSQLSHITQLGADGLFSGLLGTDGITLYKQARTYGLEKSIKVFADNSLELQIVKALGANIPDNIWSPTPWYFDDSDGNPISKYLHDEYQKRNPTDKFPYGWTAFGHDAIVAYAEAIRTAKTTNIDAVRSALENGSPLGAIGSIRFRKEDHGLISDLTLINFGSDKSAPEGWKVFEVVRIPSRDFLEPATPGVKYVIE